MGRCSAADRAGRRDQTPRPSGVARGPGARWAPFRTGLRCHFGRCWASATGRQHPRRQPRPKPLPSPTPKKGGRMSPSWGATEPGGLLVEGAGRVPPRPLQRLPPLAHAGVALHFFHQLRRLRPWSSAPHLANFCKRSLRPGGTRPATDRAGRREDQNFYAASRGDSLKNCLYQIKKAYTVHTRRLLSALPFLWSSSSFISFSVWKNF